MKRAMKILGTVVLCLALAAPAMAMSVSRNVHNGMPLYNSDQALEKLRLAEVGKTQDELLFLCRAADEVWPGQYGKLQATLGDLGIGASVEYTYSNFCMTWTKVLQQAGPMEMRGLSWALGSVMSPVVGSAPYSSKRWISANGTNITLKDGVWGGALGAALLQQYGSDLGTFFAAWRAVGERHDARPEPYRSLLVAIVKGDVTSALKALRAAVPEGDDAIRTLYEVSYDQMPVHD